MYEISVVEIAMSSTIWNVASSPLSKNAIAAKQNTVETIAGHDVDAHGRAEAPVEHAEPREERAVVGGDGLDPVRADHPDGARRDERADEADRHQDQQRVRGAAVDAERLRDGVDEAADAGDVLARQHEHDAEDRDHVEQHAE